MTSVTPAGRGATDGRIGCLPGLKSRDEPSRAATCASVTHAGVIARATRTTEEVSSRNRPQIGFDSCRPKLATRTRTWPISSSFAHAASEWTTFSTWIVPRPASCVRVRPPPRPADAGSPAPASATVFAPPPQSACLSCSRIAGFSSVDVS